MRKFTLAAVVGAGAIVTGTLAAGVAGADVVGGTYADAVETINGWGGTPVVSTVIGERTSRDECIVTNSRRDPVDNSKFLLSLNCNNAVAEPGHAGNSAASPAGRAAKQKADSIEWRSQNPEWCLQALDVHPEWGELEGCDYSYTPSDGEPASE